MCRNTFIYDIKPEFLTQELRKIHLLAFNEYICVYPLQYFDKSLCLELIQINPANIFNIPKIMIDIDVINSYYMSRGDFILYKGIGARSVDKHVLHYPIINYIDKRSMGDKRVDKILIELCPKDEPPAYNLTG